MGVCSTVRISRERALTELIGILVSSSDRKLEEILNEIAGGERPLVQLQGFSLARFEIGEE